MKRLLEERLSGLDENTVGEVKRALTVPHVNPKKEWRSMPYLKDDLVCQILIELKISQNFGSSLYSGETNKAPLKRVYYGIRSMGELPDKFLNSLTNWEKIYFSAGRWKIRNPDLKEPIDVLTARHLYTGLGLLYSHHYKRKAKGRYERDIKLPEDKDVRKAYNRILKAYKEKQRKKEKKVIQGELF